MTAPANEPEPPKRRARRAVRVLAVLTGLALTIIGIRFLTMPGPAAKFFGAGPGGYPTALHHVIGLRDIWLGLLAVALAVLNEWRALALWLALGALVCFADSAIAWSATGRATSIAFHIASGLFCAGLAVACWRRR